MTKILEFPSLASSPDLTFFVIPQLDLRISSNRRHCEGAISLLFTAAASQKHCASLSNSRIP
ncbi:MAG: hypothetical protein PUI01_03030 [Campylobacteraceae bacterium]|nr:hypothetical protein [Campylobacteraceae bacterium]